jgi:hypothetical protein
VAFRYVLDRLHLDGSGHRLRLLELFELK